MDLEKILIRTSDVVKKSRSLLLLTHKDPDIDAVGSMLALSRALVKINKEVVNICEKPVSPPLVFLKGSEKIIQKIDKASYFDLVVTLDCSNAARLGKLECYLKNGNITINIDHHETNSFFADINIVGTDCSSTAELVLKLIKAAEIQIDHEIAENIFAAIQSDTGCFKYENTTQSAFYMAAEMMSYGANPWDVTRKIMDNYSRERLKLLEISLRNIEFFYKGKVAIITLTSEMFKNSGALIEECEGFIDLPRYVSGVEVAVMIRQIGEDKYKFSIRSNRYVDVSQLAGTYGGGGHERAAGFEHSGKLRNLKEDFLNEMGKFIDGDQNKRHLVGR